MGLLSIVGSNHMCDTVLGRLLVSFWNKKFLKLLNQVAKLLAVFKITELSIYKHQVKWIPQGSGKKEPTSGRSD